MITEGLTRSFTRVGGVAALCGGLLLLGAMVGTAPAPTAMLGTVSVLLFISVGLRGPLFAWDVFAVVLGGLMILAYGFINVGLVPGVPVPLADIVIVGLGIYAILTTRFDGAIRVPLFFGAVYLAIATTRLIVDYHVWGMDAVRDYTIAVELVALPVGYWSMQRFGLRRWVRLVGVISIVMLAYGLAYPLRGTIASISPVVGLQQPVLLFGSYSGPAIVTCFLACLILRPFGERRSLVAAALFLPAIAVQQSRGMFIAVPLSLLVIVFGSGRLAGRLRRATATVVVLGIVAVALTFTASPEGRLGPTNAQQIAEQLHTLHGGQGTGAGTFKVRTEWFFGVLHKVNEQPLGWLVGLGLGPDLTNGFQTNSILVRKPHDDYLEAYARLGIGGLAALVLLLVSATVPLFRAARSRADAVFRLPLVGRRDDDRLLVHSGNATAPCIRVRNGSPPRCRSGRHSLSSTAFRAPTGTAEQMDWSRIRRAAWSVGDQAISSLMGLGLSVAVAHAVSAHAFGAFAIAIAAYYLALGWSRALASDVFVVRFTDKESNSAASIHAARGSAAGTVVALGVVLGLLFCATSGLVDGETRSVFVALGVALPALLLQDFMRYSFFAAGRGYLAFTTDAIWASLSVVAVGSSLAIGLDDPALFIVEWGAGAGVAALLGLAFARFAPKPRNTVRWLRAHRDLAFRFFAEITIMNATSSLSIVLVGTIAGLQAAGAIRAAIVLMGPLSVILMASALFGVAEGVNASRRSLRALRVLALQISSAFAVVALLWTAAVSLIPAHVGRQILGDSWGGARQVLIAVGFYMVALGAMSGAFIGMRSLAAARQSLHARMLIAPLVLLGAGVGAATDGATGAALGMAIANWMAVAIAWRGLGVAMRHHVAAPERGIHREVGAPDLPLPSLSPS